MRKTVQQRGVALPLIIIGVLVVLVVVFFLVTGDFKFSVSTNQPSSPEQSAQSEPQNYQNDAYGLSLIYPGNWSFKNQPTAQYVVAFYSPQESSADDYREFVGIKIIDISSQPDLTVQAVADLWESQTAEESAGEDNFQVAGREAATVSGEEARDIIFTADLDGDQIKGFARVVLKNGNAYIFEYFAKAKAYDKYLPDVESILASTNL
ncbi:hypothetical protein A2886_02090 [candidate division WWE3 bacterium RIFCSPHIGHO2_01_FULL_42_13]|uniref:PsbP C-terminal domain-containing protein n=1 Tax=candidate division WWE3 bacterium RIFCSPHIGHO2_01_FULL_42_13 TaxID=1802617 RepID=A0A1F4URH8_UNCKA|nr:MAG: hypothetical protein A2886_02090 [candidate division WWE3 bacterium RIFCSPHIGHO2_01_FULL_42_13]